MKILFLNPLDENNCARIVVQPIGLMYLASALRTQFDHHEIKILDMKLHFMTNEDAIREIKEFSPDVIGIRTLSVEAEAVHVLSGMIKQNHPYCKLIIGGPHTISSTGSILKDPNVDFVVIGEGEVTICDLMAEIERGNDFPNVDGIAYVREGEVVFTQPREMIQDINQIPFPAWDLINVEDYFKIPGWLSHVSNHMSIFTSRGCPYRCAYCHRVFGKKTRLRSADNVLKEIDILYHQYGVRELKFIDDIFNINRRRVREICDGILERKLDLTMSFPNGLRGDIMDTATLKKLKDAGTIEITYAVETASPRMQKLIKKHVRLGKLKKVIDETVENGIFTKGFFMMGFPSETREEINATAEYALKSKFHWINIFVVNPFEGTDLADMAIKMGVNIDYDNLDFGGGYKKNPVQLSEMPIDEIKALQFKTMRKFIFDPRRIFSAYKCTHSKKNLFVFALVTFLKMFIPASRRERWIRRLFINAYDSKKKRNQSRERRSKRIAPFSDSQDVLHVSEQEKL